ncbi:hypothetical protein QJS83_06800 [Bdellovibrio sp. 22V]|uniref:hypothetical protein n=1 Tax=Bdellovibrio sp. 22V TaxID=3044166 RepID=UPI0025439FB8|nr:hypothetical protein [Bdellovibrio sp. 22V]WII73579.1 hypothetical protein QJS83_06800 [Bdellovibrio sp. 22V]
MRFTIVTTIILMSSISMASIKDFNGLIGKVSEEEKEVHQKLLKATEDTEVSQAFNRTLERIRYIEGKRQVKIAVNLVPENEIAQ